MKYALWICVAVLLVLHQDYWQWDDATLDFGFMPRTLTYHVVLSVVAAAMWLFATQYWWPSDLTESSHAKSDSQSNESGDAS